MVPVGKALEGLTGELDLASLWYEAMGLDRLGARLVDSLDLTEMGGEIGASTVTWRKWEPLGSALKWVLVSCRYGSATSVVLGTAAVGAGSKAWVSQVSARVGCKV